MHGIRLEMLHNHQNQIRSMLNKISLKIIFAQLALILVVVTSFAAASYFIISQRLEQSHLRFHPQNGWYAPLHGVYRQSV